MAVVLADQFARGEQVLGPESMDCSVVAVAHYSIGAYSVSTTGASPVPGPPRPMMGSGPVLPHGQLQLRRERIVMPAKAIRLHRVLRVTPERIYRAFLDAD